MARSLFRNTILLSGLVSQEQIDAAVASLTTSGPAGAAQVEVDDNALAVRMVELGVLTSYQAEQIKSGRTKFSLGPYTVTDFIGQGGMGRVYKGVHQVMGRECAIKVLPVE